MNAGELRYRVISTLLQAEAPMDLPSLARLAGIPAGQASQALDGLVGENLVVQGNLAPDQPGPQYCWRARWSPRTQAEAVRSRQDLEDAVQAVHVEPAADLAIDSGPVNEFCDYVMRRYAPPKDKRFLVILQCSVRRPFSTSPSHASMRRAIALATGFDPARQFIQCPVHVVVLASRIGPVPYELEDVYPANVRGGGVKHFDPALYVRIKPILAQRMAGYILAHRGAYQRIATFTEGRYCEVMEAARDIVVQRGGPSLEFAILPSVGGREVLRLGRSRPRKYWERFWIQLYNEIVEWLDAPARRAAAERLRGLGVVVSGD